MSCLEPQSRIWVDKEVSVCFHSCAWYRGEGWGQAACRWCRAANSHGVPGFGRGVWLWAPYLNSPFTQLALVLPYPLWEEAAHVNYNPYENVEEPDKIGGVAYFKYTLGINEKASSISHPFQIRTSTETHTCFQCNYSQSELDLAIAP